MSKGLGKIQRSIVDALSRSEYVRERGERLLELAGVVCHPERFKDNGDPKDEYSWHAWETTKAEYLTVYRAVRTLEQRGTITVTAERDAKIVVGQRGALFQLHDQGKKFLRVRLSVNSENLS